MKLEQIAESVVEEAKAYVRTGFSNLMYIWVTRSGYVSSQDGRPLPDADVWCIPVEHIIGNWWMYEGAEEPEEPYSISSEELDDLQAFIDRAA